MWGTKRSWYFIPNGFYALSQILIAWPLFFLGIPAAIGSDTCDHLRVVNKLQGSNWKKLHTIVFPSNFQNQEGIL